jgi:hypothetical protein
VTAAAIAVARRPIVLKCTVEVVVLGCAQETYGEAHQKRAMSLTASTHSNHTQLRVETQDEAHVDSQGQRKYMARRAEAHIH